MGRGDRCGGPNHGSRTSRRARRGRRLGARARRAASRCHPLQGVANSRDSQATCGDPDESANAKAPAGVCPVGASLQPGGAGARLPSRSAPVEPACGAEAVLRRARGWRVRVRDGSDSSELISPPGRVRGVGLDDFASGHDLVVESPYEGAQFAGALLRQGVEHGFEVVAGQAGVAAALGVATATPRPRVGDLPQWTVCQGAPVCVGPRCLVGPETDPFQTDQIGLARSGQAVDGSTSTAAGEMSGKFASQGGGAPTRHCPFGSRSYGQRTSAGGVLRSGIRGAGTTAAADPVVPGFGGA